MSSQNCSTGKWNKDTLSQSHCKNPMPVCQPFTSEVTRISAGGSASVSEEVVTKVALIFQKEFRPTKNSIIIDDYQAHAGILRFLKSYLPFLYHEMFTRTLHNAFSWPAPQRKSLMRSSKLSLHFEVQPTCMSNKPCSNQFAHHDSKIRSNGHHSVLQVVIKLCSILRDFNHLA